MNQNVPMTPFGMAVVELGLTLEQQEKAKALATVFKITLMDPDIYRVCLHVKENGTLTEALEKFEALGKQIGDDIDQRSNALLSSVSTEIGNAIREKVDNLPAIISDKVDQHVEKRVKHIVQETVIKTNDDRDKLELRNERRKDRREYGIILVSVLALLVGAVAVTRSITWDQAVAKNARLEQMEKRPDLPVWIEWMRNNDARKLQAQFCTPGQGMVINGQKKCRVDIATSSSLQSTTGLDGLVAVWREVQVTLGFYGAMALGAAGTLLTMWTRRKKA